MNITVFGKGNMGKAIGANFEKAGNQVTYAGRDFKDVLGDMVVLAVPYGAVDAIISAQDVYKRQMSATSHSDAIPDFHFLCAAGISV